MKIPNRIIANYLIWVAANLIVLAVFGRLEFGQSKSLFGSCGFYPFGGLTEIDDYDISEFLVYTIVPFLVILAIWLRKSSPSEK